MTRTPTVRCASLASRGFGVWWFPAFLVILLFCTDVRMQTPAGPPEETLELGDTLASFPPPDGPELAGIRQLALSADGESVYVLDSDPRIHRIGLDGRLLASFGGEGQGPGELDGPSAMQPAADGVWVLDRRRLTRFAKDGSVAETRAATDWAAATFAPVGDDMIVIPAGQPMTSSRALFNLVATDGVTDLASRDVPDALSGSDFVERLVGWKLAALGDRSLAIVLNGPELLAWRTTVREDGSSIGPLSELPIPATAARVVSEESRASAMPDARPSPLLRAEMVEGKLWIVSTGLGNGPVAFTAPLRGRRALASYWREAPASTIRNAESKTSWFSRTGSSWRATPR